MPLAHPETFFDRMRAGILGPELSAGEVDGCNVLLAACEGWPVSYVAYAMGTAYHETAHTLQPVREKGSGDKDHDGVDDWFEKYDTGSLAETLGNTPGADGDGQKYCGRGYVQLTGHKNYAWAQSRLGRTDIDLVADPDQAMRPDVAAAILRHGMEEGAFTGKRLSSYLPASGPASRSQFVEARRIINGQDRAEDIAGYALKFQDALSAGGWGA